MPPLPRPARREYHSPLRQERADATRDRIVRAGSELAHTFTSWDWRGLTFRAVAQRAGVGERAVYRHFPTQRELHDAVMQRLGAEAGVSYDGMSLGAVADVAARVFESLGAFAVQPSEPSDDAAFVAEDVRRRFALRRAVADAVPDLPPGRDEEVAAALDVVWAVPSDGRLVGSWVSAVPRPARWWPG